jgi:dihydroorotase
METKQQNRQFDGLKISQARLIDPSQGLDLVGNLLIIDGKIVWLGRQDEPTPFEGNFFTFNAGGLIASPGFIDLHCHLREPGFEDKETIASGLGAAVRGGFTTICCMPNTEPPIDNAGVVGYIRNKARLVGIGRVLPIGCITKGRGGGELAEMAELAKSGVAGFSDDGNSVPDSLLMRRAMEYSCLFNLPIIEHCEDSSLTKGGVMNEGWLATKLGLRGIPNAAEDVTVARDIALSELSGAKLHLAHISTAGSVELIRQAKEKGLKVTAEATPHHLTLTEERVIGYDTNAKVNPPLRTEKDRQALLEGLREGVIDAIATDHSPHTIVDKQCEFDLAAFGISGFETALGSLMGLVHQGELDLKTLLERLTFEPTKVLQGGPLPEGLGTFKIGAPGDVVIFDSEAEWQVEPEKFASRGKNNPWAGCLFRGKVMATISGGEVVYQDERLR